VKAPNMQIWKIWDTR